MPASGPLIPTLDADMQATIRVAYGVLQFLTLAAALPHARRYFVSERWGGYAQSRPSIDAVQNLVVSAVLLSIWLAASVALVVGRWVVAAAAINLVLSYYFFIRMRWGGVLRGMGAPGFISFWLGAAVFLLELTSRHAPAVAGLALLTLQIDFALIMLSAGVYKMIAGYRVGDGMQLGMVNPEWGYWASRWRRWPPHHPLFRLLNELAWGTEVAAGVLMLLPPTRLFGAAAIALSFVFIATEIRLGFLCEMVIVCCLLFVPGGGGAVEAGPLLPDVVQRGLQVFFWVYLAMLPIVRAGMYYNQLAHRALAPSLQRALDAYTNAFGLIIWRVFTADVVSFFIQIWEEPPAGAPRTLVSSYTGFPWTNRFRQVAECIAVTSVFTTLKYYPSNRALFVDRLLRYARTIPRSPGSRLVFEWVHVAKRPGWFDYVPIAEYHVDTEAGTVSDRILSDIVSVQAPASSASPIHEAMRPGTYVPLKR